MADLLGMLPLCVDADKASEAEEEAYFHFRDTGETLVIKVI